MTDIAPEVQQLLIADLVAKWKNTMYQHSVQVKVYKMLGDQQQIDFFTTEMTKCQKALDMLQAEIEGLNKTNG